MNPIKNVAVFAAGLALVIGAASASAQEKKKADAAPAPPAAAPAMKPDPALDQYKGMLGRWRCEGKLNFMGQEMPLKATMTFAWELDNYWMVGKLDVPKTKAGPGHKAVTYYGYDTAAKVYVQQSVDSEGGSGHATSKGWEGDKLEWAGKEKMMGMERDMKETVTKKGAKEVTISGSSGAGDKLVAWDLACKK